VQAAYRAGELVEGEVAGTTDGGFTVDVGVRAFLPASQVGMRPVRRPDDILGQRLTFKIIRFDRNRQNVVLSRRVLLEAERDARLGRLRVGAVIDGTVRSFTEYGAFVDIGGGIDGLLHIEEMGWTRIRRPQEAVKLGEEVKCKVIGLDKGKKRISLSLRQLQDDPWLTIQQTHPVGSKVTGLVVSKTDFGAFLDLLPGLEGLVLSSGALVDPGDAAALRKVDIGDELEAKVVDVDVEGRRLSLVLAMD
ncbi:MAG: S1 RNA-binding domain-containing protein, partial [Myxococcota bacterium]